MPPQEHTEEQQDAENTTSHTRVNPRVIKPYHGELVIAGLSGRYPESDNVTEFKDNLLNKINMVSVDSKRWDSEYWHVPPQMGALKNLDKFDAEFFGIHSKSAETLDPQLRLLLEVAYEAVVDAGESLASMKGTRTGVYIGVTGSEAEHAWMGRTNQYVLSGVPHTFFPNRLSFFFDLRGPSCAYDTACSTGIVTMEAALLHLRSGVVDQAIVGAVNLIMRPQTTRAFTAMNMLGGGACRTFDAAGDGFVRAETISACLLKKAECAKRIYCTVEACISNNDGWSTDGLVFPNTYAQEELMRDLYTNYKIDPTKIKYFECHGTGTPAGDPIETRAICSVICENRKDPLLIGSTKTNMGHSEVASGLSSLTKVIIAMHTRVIPPNLHFQTPHPNIPGLFDGRLKVVTEPTPWEGGLVALNSFGMGGSNGHIVLRSYDEKKLDDHPASEKPRLFVYSARTEDGLKNILKEAHKHSSDVEFHALCQISANAQLGSMPFRGATLLNAEKEFTEIQKVASKPRELWFVYSGMGSQWVGMGRSLMALDIFRDAIHECSDALKPFGIDLLNLIMNGTQDSLKTIIAPFICIVAVQLALTDLLFSMGIKPNGLVGHSLGEGSCAYADGCHTKRETMIAAYLRGQSVVESNVAPGRMAAVGRFTVEITLPYVHTPKN
ncbi:fatty acid synthase-like [Elysia marginata]|uniref:Fatty acid synthase n=1 Tax=Elysia marginata TaxID=1093978 RepID=A0AAV4J6X1_9GAST|nr:fatty acid synthase-like [Elysia marginata]